ncbi:MAG: hypothetical protein JO002_13265 [Burkholderiaceae bacterium]|nr:hypothetical protein [Burkholderiaceae bacterium]
MFDSGGLTRNLEQAYLQMLAQQAEKRGRVAIVIAADGGVTPMLEQAAQSICTGIRALGAQAEVQHKAFERHGLNLILGAHRLTAEGALLLPPRAIICRLDTDAQGEQWLTPALRDLLREYELWDCDPQSTAAIAAELPGARIKHVPFDALAQAVASTLQTA